MPVYNIKHITRYTYPEPVIDSANQVILFPINDEKQLVKKHELIITHQPEVEVFNDYFGNRVGIFSVIKPHTELSIVSKIEVETYWQPLPVNQEPVGAQWEKLAAARTAYPCMDFMILEQFEVYDTLHNLVQSMVSPSIAPLEAAQQMSAFIYHQFEYKKGITSVETGVDEIWRLKAGVCQDFAHILLMLLRMAGIPARYVSGYICPANHEWRGEGATHAWVEAFIPAYGWLGLDPTNNCIAAECHVRLAVGRNFSDCTPVKGTYKGSSEHRLEVSVTIENGEAPATREPAPVFTYQVESPGKPANSYRRFMEIQQQQ